MSGDWDINKLRNYGFTPKTIIDVGAAAGTNDLYEAFPNAYFVLLEPLKEYENALREVLRRYKGRYFLNAVGNNIGDVEVNIESHDLERTSINKRSKLTSSKDEITTRKIPITTLDVILKENQLQSPFGLKIDTEGFELQVIQGATELLKQTDFVIAEVSVAKRFERSYRFAEFIELMHNNGFNLYDILYEYRKEGLLMYVDCLFKKQ